MLKQPPRLRDLLQVPSGADGADGEEVEVSLIDAGPVSEGGQAPRASK